MLNDLVVLSAKEAQSKINNTPNIYRVVSISSPEFPISLQRTKELLELRFDDVEEDDDIFPHVLATEEHCSLALRFLQKGGLRILHCRAGISRSSALCLGYLLSEMSYKSAVNQLAKIRPQANPNRHTLGIMCKILEKEYLYDLVMKYAKYPEKTVSKYRKKYLQKQLNIAYNRVKKNENSENLLHLIKMICGMYSQLATGKMDVAISLTRQILESDPENTEVLYWQAKCFELLTRYKQAVEQYQLYLEMSKGDNRRLEVHAQKKITHLVQLNTR
ncbi:dual specificity protein phosphatase family protein [Candidatus Uabimicrobium sp. HlEnr_7]|uniref:dual specificity protein phosphatase family protein n=1 Tax=Candidatus Uabimicrobium helgolandensis TaxID=3095367 RepID=UPI0035570D06